MNFSIDCDGTATKYPALFVTLGRALRAQGHRVYILTGIPLSVFNTKRMQKYPHLSDTSWYDEVLTSDLYNDNERVLAMKVISGEMDNHELVGIFKRRICADAGISLHFDDDVGNVRRVGSVPVFGVS